MKINFLLLVLLLTTSCFDGSGSNSKLYFFSLDEETKDVALHVNKRNYYGVGKYVYQFKVKYKYPGYTDFVCQFQFYQLDNLKVKTQDKNALESLQENDIYFLYKDLAQTNKIKHPLKKYLMLKGAYYQSTWLPVNHLHASLFNPFNLKELNTDKPNPWSTYTDCKNALLTDSLDNFSSSSTPHITISKKYRALDRLSKYRKLLLSEKTVFKVTSGCGNRTQIYFYNSESKTFMFFIMHANYYGIKCSKS